MDRHEAFLGFRDSAILKRGQKLGGRLFLLVNAHLHNLIVITARKESSVFRDDVKTPTLSIKMRGGHQLLI